MADPPAGSTRTTASARGERHAEDQRTQIERELTSALSRSDIIAAWIFGSRARGAARDDSDIDVAVLLRQAPPPTLEGLPFDLQFEIEERLGRRADVVVVNRAPADLVHRILRDGHLIVDRDRSARIAFEVRSRNEYFDLLPILERYRRSGSPSGQRRSRP